MTVLQAIVACVAMLTGLPAPDAAPTVRLVEQARIDASLPGASAASRRYRGLFWPRRRETGGPEIWLGPRATAATLAHEVAHWLQMKAGLPYADHRLPHFVERKFAAWCGARVEAARKAAVGPPDAATVPD